MNYKSPREGAAERSGGRGGVVRGGAVRCGGGDVEVMFAELIVGAGRAVTERLRAEHDRYTEHTRRPANESL